jgi:hydroxymethylglutaryl-CoA synthase
MVGITSYGAYIPRYRINRMTIYGSIGFVNQATIMPGEKAVGNYDEDSLTMAVNAGVDCLLDLDRNKIDCLYFATTTAPYRERSNAGIIATALDLKPQIRIADFADSLKSGTVALVAGCDSIAAGSESSVLVCASDCRLGPAGSFQEEMYGDGAASILLGDKNVIASLEGSYSLSYDFVDHWRHEGERFNRIWEDRWVRDEGYGKFITEAIGGLMSKYKINPKDIAKVCYPCMYTRSHATIGKKLGFEPDQLQDHMFTTVGLTGTANPLMLLVAALEDAKPGDKIIVASYGSGSDAMLLEVTPAIKKIKRRKGVKNSLANKKDLTSYEKYVTFKQVLAIDVAGRGEEAVPSSSSILWRDRKKAIALVGTRCKCCGTPQLPPQRICVKPDCGAVDEMEEYRFSDKKGHIFTYTGDNLVFTPDPPELYGVIDFEGGGRSQFNLTDCDLDEIEVAMLTECTFRRKYYDRGVTGYTWKAVPVRV